ncbi:hypothetical protein IEZ26_06265 [Nocardioides cavernae]|uniref:EthD domain-containing protein n=1 Tax=Nocardioides cavernae TaxID=1921566 RepID=A0ABR8N7U7_9ACTN|nr:DUF4286 family protein [Nocardioides cavernae]MBD3924218.1 hypothetical protein [Nocardioides cavernae]MBM7510843.1 hypothetical protein [Nocardioides cavernae]
MSTEPLLHLDLQLVDLDPRALRLGESWLDEDYLPEALTAGGWGRARRFTCSAEPHLQLVVLDRPDVGGATRPRPVIRSNLGRRWVRSFLGQGFTQTYESSGNTDVPEVVNAIITVVRPEGVSEFDAWYSQVHVPDILACPGWEAARRFRAVDGTPMFLALYELADATMPFQSPEYERAVGWDEVEHHIAGYHGFRTYELSTEVSSSP